MEKVLRTLIDELYANPTNKDFAKFGEMISKIANRTPPWGMKYIRGCYYGYKNISVSKKLARALDEFAALSDNQSPLLARIEGRPPKLVYSPNGLEEGSIILGHTERCAFCLVKFVPRSCTNPDHNRFCCSEHRQQYYKEKRKARRAKHG